MAHPRNYGPKKRTKRERDIAALMLKTLTDETPATDAGLAAKIAKLTRAAMKRGQW